MPEHKPGGFRGDPLRAANAALDRLKVFPLEGVALLPGTALPLHIFEPRYRKMLSDCRADDYVLALATPLSEEAEDGEPPPLRPTVGVGLVVFDQRLDDGRSIIIVHGVMRARIDEELHEDLPYRTVRATALPDAAEPSAETPARVELLRHLVRQVARTIDSDQCGDDLVRLAQDEPDPGRLADLVGGVLMAGVAPRLRLLEELRPDQRLELVNEHLATMLQAAARCEELEAPN